MIALDIPNCPSTGLKRKITGRTFMWYDEESIKQIIINNRVQYFDAQNNLIPTIERFKKLVATNDTLVNPTNGALLSEAEARHNKTHEAQIAEYNRLNDIYQTQLAAWQELPTVIKEQTPEPIAPTPVAAKHPAMGEYDFYVLVIGSNPVNLPQILDGVTLNRLDKFQNIL